MDPTERVWIEPKYLTSDNSLPISPHITKTVQLINTMDHFMEPASIKASLPAIFILPVEHLNEATTSLTAAFESDAKATTNKLNSLTAKFCKEMKEIAANSNKCLSEILGLNSDNSSFVCGFANSESRDNNKISHHRNNDGLCAINTDNTMSMACVRT